MSDFLSFGEWVRSQREHADLSRTELSDRIGCAPNTLYKIEQNLRRPSKDMVERILGVFQVPGGERPALRQLARSLRIQDSEAARSKQEPAPLPILPGIPLPLTSLIDRETTAAAIVSLTLQPNVRLITLTGPPGVGKTRMGLTALHALAPAFADGVAFVALDTLTSPDQMLSALSASLRVDGLRVRDPRQMLKDWLATKQVLLVLDNFEHLLPAAPLLTDILNAAPRCKALVTSRETLAVYGEYEYVVPPLDTPPVAMEQATDLRTFPAIQLFLERAKAVRHGWEPTDAMLHTIRDVCVELDGIPLAIELVAALIKFHDPAVLQQTYLQRIMAPERRLSDRPVRQQSLRGALDWSMVLLEPEEAMFCIRLGVFAGQTTLAAIQAMCGTNPDDPTSIERRLHLLVEKSLVRMHALPPHGQTYSLLHIIRGYMRERAGERGVLLELEERHACYYVGWTEEANAHLISPDQQVWLDRIDAALPNIRQALTWFHNQGNYAWLKRGIQALISYWFLRGDVHEGGRWLQVLLESGVITDPADQIALNHGAGVLSYARSDYAAAQSYYQRCLDIQVRYGIADRLAGTYNNLGLVAWREQRLDDASTLIQHALEIRRASQHQQGAALALMNLGMLACEQGEWASGEQYLQESLALTRGLDDQPGVAVGLHNLGHMHLEQERYADAERYLQESSALSARLGLASEQANDGESLGLLYLAQGKRAAARASFLKSLRLRKAAGDRHGLADSLLGLGGWAIADGEPALGVQWISLATSLYAQLQVSFSPMGALRRQRWLDHARTMLPEAAWNEAFAMGRRMDGDRVVATLCALPGDESADRQEIRS